MAYSYRRNFTLLSISLILATGARAGCDAIWITPERMNVQAAHVELEDVKAFTTAQLEALGERCKGVATCIQNGMEKIEDAARQRLGKFWGHVDESSSVDPSMKNPKGKRGICLKSAGGNRDHAKKARANYFRGLLVNSAGIGFGWKYGVQEYVTVTDKNGNEKTEVKLPYALIGEAIISGAIWAEAACRSTLAGGSEEDVLKLPIFQRLKSYTTPVLLGSTIFVGLNVAQDRLIYGQKDALSAEKLKDYYYLAIASLTFDVFYAGVHGLGVDYMLIKKIPEYRQQIAAWVRTPKFQALLPSLMKSGKSATQVIAEFESKVLAPLPQFRAFLENWVKTPMVQKHLPQILKNGKTMDSLMEDLEAGMIGFLMEYTSRVGYFSAKNISWTYLEDYMVPRLKNSPLFNFMFSDWKPTEPEKESDKEL